MTTLWILLLNICSYAGKSRPINPRNMTWWVYSFLKCYLATVAMIPHSQSSIGDREPFLENRALWMLVRYPVTTSIPEWNQGAHIQPKTYWVSHLSPLVVNQQISGKLTLCVRLTPGSPAKGRHWSNTVAVSVETKCKKDDRCYNQAFWQHHRIYRYLENDASVNAMDQRMLHSPLGVQQILVSWLGVTWSSVLMKTWWKCFGYTSAYYHRRHIY